MGKCIGFSVFLETLFAMGSIALATYILTLNIITSLRNSCIAVISCGGVLLIGLLVLAAYRKKPYGLLPVIAGHITLLYFLADMFPFRSVYISYLHPHYRATGISSVSRVVYDIRGDLFGLGLLAGLVGIIALLRSRAEAADEERAQQVITSPRQPMQAPVYNVQGPREGPMQAPVYQPGPAYGQYPPQGPPLGGYPPQGPPPGGYPPQGPPPGGYPPQGPPPGGYPPQGPPPGGYPPQGPPPGGYSPQGPPPSGYPTQGSPQPPPYSPQASPVPPASHQGSPAPPVQSPISPSPALPVQTSPVAPGYYPPQGAAEPQATPQQQHPRASYNRGYYAGPNRG